MALKRLDEEFELKPGTQLLPYMRRLLPSLEGRFQTLEATAGYAAGIAEEIRAAALIRMNEILIPATEDIIAVTKLGFLLGPSSTLMELKLGPTFLIIDEGPQRNSFTPSPYLIIEREANHDDYAIARMDGYTQATGELLMTITAWHGNAGPWSDWVVSSTPGMADSTKLYHDAVGPMHDTVEADHAEVVVMHQEILDAIEGLEEAGLDLFNYVRRDGTVPFTAVQPGVHPAVGSNDNSLTTSAWSRARMIEYSGNAVQRSGSVMSGPLTLSGPPVAPLHAVTKAYVDALIGAGGVISNSVTIHAVNPSLALRSTLPGQTRMIEALGQQGMRKWVLNIADSAAESGGETGSNFSLVRYSDSGTLIDIALSVSRQTGITTVRGLNSSAAVNVTGNFSAVGDISIYRAAAPTTGVVYLNQAKTAYHQYDGTNHQLIGGGLTTGHLNCLSISTQGHATTTWGLTSHGHVAVNSSLRAQSLHVSSTAPSISMEDVDYATMTIHCNQGIIGFLNWSGNWIQYTNYNGQIWTPAYGWIHDYVYYNNGVQNTRWVHAGDVNFDWYYYQLGEIGNACITGLWVVGVYYAGYATSVYQARWRQMQHMIQGGWYTSGWAS